MNELQSVTDIDEVIKYAEREAEGCHQMSSAYHTDEGVYLHEETRFRYKAILWENIHEWLEELKELREQKRPHGEWVEVGYTEDYHEAKYRCTNCKTEYKYTDFTNIALVECFPNFCPNCGADMRKEGGEK